MALKAGRVGVAKDQVDEFGHITGGATPENVYTKSQCDNKFELKSHIGGLKFRDNDGTAQYMLPNGEWTNFSSASGEVGIVLSSPEASGVSPRNNTYHIISGGYQVVDHICYVSIEIESDSDVSLDAGRTIISGLPLSNSNGNKLMATSKDTRACYLTVDTGQSTGSYYTDGVLYFTTDKKFTVMGCYGTLL